MILSLTILIICTLALVEWTFTAYSVQVINSAAAEGARTAAGVFPSAATRDARVQATVSAILTPLGFDNTGLTVNVVDATTYLTVTVTVPVTSSPIPSLLTSFGFNLTGKSLRASSVAWAT
jgi:Flp pilus assembly protein TadG